MLREIVFRIDPHFDFKYGSMNAVGNEHMVLIVENVFENLIESQII